MFTDYYAEQSCTAGRSSFITGQATLRTGLSKVGLPARRRRPAAEDITIAEAAQAAGLCHRPVRQEPSRRPQRVPADGARLRRVLRQPLPPQRRGGAGASRLSRRTRRSARSSARAACSSAWPPTPTTRPSIRASARSASRRSRTPARSPRSAWRRSTTRPRDAAIDFIERQATAGKPFFVLVERHAHALLHARARRASRPAAAWRQRVCRRHDRARRPRRRAAQDARRSRHRQRHHRRLLDRQRPAHELLAGRRHDAVPQREEHQLGRRLPRAGDGALAGPHQAGHGLERDRSAARLVPDAAGRGRRARRQGEAAQGLRRRRAAPSRCTSTATTSCPT